MSPWASPQTIGSMLAAQVAVVRPGPGWGQAGRERLCPLGSVRAVFVSTQRGEPLGFAAKVRDPSCPDPKGRFSRQVGPEPSCGRAGG